MSKLLCPIIGYFAQFFEKSKLLSVHLRFIGQLVISAWHIL